MEQMKIGLQLYGIRNELAKDYEGSIKAVKEMGYAGGKLRIAHCRNEKAASELKTALLAQFKNADISIGKTGALCSFYAEEGGMIIGFEGAFNEHNDNSKF